MGMYFRFEKDGSYTVRYEKGAETAKLMNKMFKSYFNEISSEKNDKFENDFLVNIDKSVIDFARYILKEKG